MPRPSPIFAYKERLAVCFFLGLASTNSLDGDAGGAGSEDCLKVNVYAPAGAKSGDKCAAPSHKLQP